MAGHTRPCPCSLEALLPGFSLQTDRQTATFQHLFPAPPARERWRPLSSEVPAGSADRGTRLKVGGERWIAPNLSWVGRPEPSRRCPAEAQLCTPVGTDALPLSSLKRFLVRVPDRHLFWGVSLQNTPPAPSCRTANRQQRARTSGLLLSPASKGVKAASKRVFFF